MHENDLGELPGDGDSNIKGFSEMEKMEMLGFLEKAKECIETQLEKLPEKVIVMSVLESAEDFLKKARMTNLAAQIRSRAIPKAEVLALEKGMEYLSTPDADETAVAAFQDLLGHQVVVGMWSSRKHCSESFHSAIVQFVLTHQLLAKHYLSAGSTYEMMGDKKKAEEMEKEHDAMMELPRDQRRALKPGAEEVIQGTRRAYAEFVEMVKSTEEYNIDLKTILREIESGIDDEVAKLR